MPFVIPAIVAGLASGTTLAAGIGFSWASFAGSLLLSGASRLLAPRKPKSNGGAANIASSGATTTVKQPLMSHKLIYGEMRIGGGIVFWPSTENNKYSHMVVVLAPHEVNEIGEIWFDDVSIPPDDLDANGNVIKGKYAGLVRIKKHLGASGQTADADLVNEVAQWTTAHRLQGIAYLYIRFQWDNDAFPNGWPNVTAWVRGKSLFDPRDSSTRFSANIALFVSDYLRSSEYGFAADVDEIDTSSLIASANICDESVTTPDTDVLVSGIDAVTNIVSLQGDSLSLQRGDKVRVITTGSAPGGLATNTDYYLIPYQRKAKPRILLASSYADAMRGTSIDITDAGTGTHTLRKVGEPRYAGAIQIDTSNAIGDNLKDILSGMGGQTVYSGGAYLIQAAAYQTPTVHFNENHMVSAVSVATKIGRRERFNTVQGTYINPIFDGQPVSYPEVTNGFYVTQDGGYKIPKKIDYPATQRSGTCQRLSKIAIEKMRQEITWSCDFNLSAMQVRAGDTAYFSFAPMGWTDKVFEIVSWKLGSRTDSNGMPVPFITLGLRETAATIYDWHNGEETVVDLAPNTTYPNPFFVAPIIGLGVDSEQVSTTGGDFLNRIILHWDKPTDYFVLSGGSIEIQVKKSADLAWMPAGPSIPGESISAEVSLAASLNTKYDVRVRAVNTLGRKSAWTSVLGFEIGTSSGVGTINDWGSWTDSVGATHDWENWTDAAGTTEDWEFFT